MKVAAVNRGISIQTHTGSVANATAVSTIKHTNSQPGMRMNAEH
jgi:hypothetical protein